MSEQRWMSRDEWDALPTEAERSRVIADGVRLYDGRRPPVVKAPEKKEYLISRSFYDSLTVGQERELNRDYRVVIID